MKIEQISINQIKPDENQPRKKFDEEKLERLTQSIKDNGIEQPIIVRKENDNYIIVDGERRYRASQNQLDNMPCIVQTLDNELEVLEYQLRTDCLKEELQTDELDKAIYRYYAHMWGTSSPHHEKVRKDANPYTCLIADKIGKSVKRVRIAIDRYSFKQDNKSFSENIEKKHNPKNQAYSKVNSTIAMTNRLKDKPEIRKAVIEKVLDDRKGSKTLRNNTIKEVIKEIASNDNITSQDAIAILENDKQSKNFVGSLKRDPRYIFEAAYLKITGAIESNMDFDFESVKEHIQGKMLDDFTVEISELYNRLNNLKEK